MKYLLVVFILAALSLPANAQTEKLQVVASFTILADITQQVAGDAANVTSLIPSEADPHTYQMVPQDVSTLAEADVVFISGAGLEQGILETIENADEVVNIVVASSCVSILPFGDDEHDEDHEHEAAESEGEIAGQCESHASEVAALTGTDQTEKGLGRLYEISCGGHEHEDEGEDHEHEVGSCDPHVWTNPENVMYWTLMIRDALSALDPANAETYANNAAAYLNELNILAHTTIPDLVNSLPLESRILVTNHDTLGYFADAYGFEIVGTVIPGGGTEGEPSARDLVALIDTVNENGVSAIFSENTVNTSLAEQIASESGAEVLLLYSDALSDGDGPASTYLDLMTYNVQTLTQGLSR
jgi:ABC-type Zn uptake system ZnuABC Zn-binding protein ZnuA